MLFKSYLKSFIGILWFNVEPYDVQVFRLANFTVRRALALRILGISKFSFVGHLKNFDIVCFLCLIAFLQLSLYM